MTEYLDLHIATVGASGSGKTVTAKGFAEILLRERRHLAVIDPTGAWWGMRSDASGEGPGFDIPIFGGAHGDVPVTADQGDAVGRIIGDGVSAIVDVSALRTGAEQRRFVRDLCRALRTKPDGNFHLFVDEADEFAAQKPRDDFGFQVGEELIWMAKRGRLAGFVLNLITQRPASIDKEVLTQAQTIIVHQLVAPVDQKPIVEYLRDHADKATLATIKGSLASLNRGERWIYSPRLGLLERGASPLPSTFDSSRTPEPGEAPREPKMLAEIDLGAIREALAPKDEPQNDLPATHIFGESLKSHPEFIAMRKDRDAFERRALAAEAARDSIRDELYAALEWQKMVREVVNRAEMRALPTSAVPAPAREPTPAREEPVAPKPVARAKPVTRDENGMGGLARRFLAEIEARHPVRLSWEQWAALIQRKAKGAQFNNAKAELRASGRINENDAGLMAVEGSGAAPRTRDDVVNAWRAVLPSMARKIFDAALEGGNGSYEDVAARIDRQPVGAQWNAAISQLRTNGLIADEPGRVVLIDLLPGERDGGGDDGLRRDSGARLAAQLAPAAQPGRGRALSRYQPADT
ncbi:hypothetical protein [Sphingopyxis sp. PET50]|uniref:hypothetical protein n=1 Tax=Sphingopyxis sp. PET50 TaxID=2976533 RepID=UPI0021AF4EE7|nr:hypothetical protein [Sphingopyxis sp. PET50]